MSTADATLRMILLGEDRSASKAVKGVGTEAEKSSSKLHSFGKVAAGVFAGGALIEGAQKAAEFLKGSVEAAVQDQQANAILARQLKNTTGATNDQIKATEEWVTKTAEASGTAKADLTPSLTRLATVTGSVTKAQKLTTLAMNVAAGTHQKLTSVVGAFVKAQNGSIGGLSRLGIATKNADGSTKTFAQTQKIMAAQFKGATAAAADTAAGKMKRLSVTWEEMKVQVGDKLLPVLTTLAGFFLDKVLPAVSALGSYLSTKLGPFFTNIAGIVSKTTGGMNGDVGKNLGAILDTFHSVVSIITSLWTRFGGFIQTYLGSTLKNLWHMVSGVLKIIEGVFKVFSSLLKGDWKGVWTGIKQILSGALTVVKALLKQALASLKLLWQVGWSALKAVFSAAWSGIKSLVKLEISNLLGQIKAIPGLILKLDVLFVKAGLGLMKALFHGLQSAAGAAGGFAVSIAKSIANQLITLLNKILPHNLPINAKFIHINVPLFPEIPHLAQGGIVRARPGGSLIVAGEGGRDEAVVPLGRGGVGGGDVHVTINGALDPIAVGKQVEQVLAKLQRTRGQSAFAFSAP